MLRYVLTREVVHLQQNQCPFCVGGGSVVFDWGLDLYICLNCGARQSHKGWVCGNVPRRLLQTVRIEWPPLNSPEK